MRSPDRFSTAGLAFALVLGLASGAQALAQVVIDFDAAPPSLLGDFVTAPYDEEVITTTAVGTGHYEIVADPSGADGDLALNLDDETTGLSQVTITMIGNTPFDALSLEVVNPAETAGEVTISAVGGAGSISAPTAVGTLNLPAGFQGITGLVITQNASGAFAVDDVTLQHLPEPGALPSLAVAALALAALRRRRAR